MLKEKERMWWEHIPQLLFSLILTKTYLVETNTVGKICVVHMWPVALSTTPPVVFELLCFFQEVLASAGALFLFLRARTQKPCH